ncbi:MAG: DUF1573 domain-containing protein [Hydrotalea flava]|uniref:DUF1573 domain-containing protein n=1 Tax=Hydrotalea TaxID=1004300 RepID=UPI0009449A20|nr:MULTISPECIES: DUF1573 domain-containing protein [Hydrotalea]MBY0346916.1 DUF1573 domain-containing protein [Hydrotalea flava]NIM35851.1 DUF1573 domain-containing protein [Hydrotalea flava]NIM38703.1 DUF1573 domain-containing protein [Hydrotalea flava]NIN03891.1 DUF1573 domain-containing protein [Hydrotalea flava]NIN15612.1 DUF1573 domain-containing protein [Hydrotalea flava]
MKQLLVAFFLLAGTMCFAQSPIQFNTVKHDFGKIKKGIPATYVFHFKNIGNKPVVIEVATAECGCTTPEYPKAPIGKGKSGEIKVTYNAALSGAFTKKVNVKLAGVNEPIVLTIEGIVEDSGHSK